VGGRRRWWWWQRGLGGPTAQAEAPQEAQVPAHDAAEVGPQRQVDDGVVDGGGLGEHGGHGERQRRDAVQVPEGSPHGHDGIGAPRREEARADGHAQLQGTHRRGGGGGGVIW